MAHKSEITDTLEAERTALQTLDALSSASAGDVSLLWLPAGRSFADAPHSEQSFRQIAQWCDTLPGAATVCVLTTPADAAALLPFLEDALKFQLWIAVKTEDSISPHKQGSLRTHHAALLVLTRYRGTLRHAKTRLAYTYCPACGKTTKDYGGKKHTYHEYGTLMSDVWRDITCDPQNDITLIAERLRDVFSVEPYRSFQLFDLRSCRALKPKSEEFAAKEARLPIAWEDVALPTESRLLNGDCLELLRSLPDNSVDFCFTDPPYNIQKKYDSWNDALETVEYFDWCNQWLSELYRVLKPGRTLAVLNIPLWAVRHFQHLASFMDFQSWIVWEGLSLPARMIMPAHYSIVCFSKGIPRVLPGLDQAPTAEEAPLLQPQEDFFCVRASCLTQRRKSGISDTKPIDNLWSDIHRLKHNSRRVEHPCQLPPLLMRRLYALFTRSGEIVLDCFNGAGTSTLVAHQMGRRFIGMELSPQYHLLAEQRHAQIARGEDPFGKSEDAPIVKNSRVQRVTKQKYVISKKLLQLDVKRIARELDRLPTRQEVESRSPYPIAYFDNYFVSWGEVCAAARTTGMSELPADAQEPTEQLGLFSEPIFL